MMENEFIQITSLLGDPTRAKIMWTLLEGKAFTATELAIATETSPQNISMHLAKLVNEDLLSVESQGRHRYYQFSKKEVAYAIESIITLIPQHKSENKIINEPISAIKYCRTCYDHLAGKVGVALTDKLLQQKLIIKRANDFELSAIGKKKFVELGIDVAELQLQRRSFLRPCLDWSERRHHIAGSLASALLSKMLLNDWIRKIKNSRGVVITAKGEKKLNEYFKLSL